MLIQLCRSGRFCTADLSCGVHGMRVYRGVGPVVIK